MRLHPVLLALAAVGLLLAPPTNAVTFNVSSTFDSPDSSPGDGVCHADIGVCTLRAAIQETNALAGADEIVLAAGTYLLTRVGADEDSAVTGDLDIRDHLTLTGAGPSRTIIDGGSLDRVIDVVPPFGSNVTVRGVQLAHGRLAAGGASSNAGAGARVNGPAWVAIDDCRLHGHRSSSTRSGYAIAAPYANRVLIERTEIDDCRRTDGATTAGATLALQDQFAEFRIDRSWIHDNDGDGVLAGTGVDFTIEDTTIRLQGGRGISHQGLLHLERSTLADNQDGGIDSWGTLIARECTLHGNRTATFGGGIMVWQSASVSLSSVTVTGNTADGDADGTGSGGGIYCVEGGLATLRHTVLGDNLDDSPSGDDHPDCSGALVSEGFNLIGSAAGCTITGETGGNIGGVPPGLGELGRWGGITPTRVPLIDSVVLDRGDEDCTDLLGSPLTVDQRGYPREIDGDQEQGAWCDLGAAERYHQMFFQDGFESGTCWAWSSTAGY